jgi:thiopurine S-methyltransferase
MEAEFWFDSWDRGGHCTSFHRSDIHPFLARHTPASRYAEARVLVPLCGKTNDLLYYRETASHVVGVELVEKAILQFFEENSLPYTRSGNRFEAERLTLLCGDFFALSRADVGRVDLVYDRAALVALPLAMRLRYVAKLDELSPIGAEQLVITLEYDPILDSAPFSIAPEDVATYYASGYDIEHVENQPQPNHGMIRRHGLRSVVEHGFLLKKRCDLASIGAR